MRAGFAKVDITPPLGGEKIGWLKSIPIQEIADPLYARAAVFEDNGRRAGFVQLDTLSVRWSTVNAIRGRVAAECGLPGDSLMIAATHNHCGPAVANVGDVRRDDAYVAWLTGRVVEAVGAAVAKLEPAEAGFGHTFEFCVSHNRRTVLRDGTAICHGAGFKHPLALHTEGPIDPEVAVLAARRPGGGLIGALVNFACHPTQRGGEPVITAGYPGFIAAELAANGCPEMVFLNGACGNISPGTHTAPGLGMEEIGRRLGQDALAAIAGMTFTPELALDAATATIELPYRQVTDAEIAGTVRGAQRFIDPKIYDRHMPGLLERIRQRQAQPAEVQVLRTGGVAWTAVPAEFFVELGLRLKAGAHPLHGLAVSHANGMVGYVPTLEAFSRGGYETTFGPAWRLAPKAGELLVGAGLQLLGRCRPGGAPGGAVQRS